MSAIRIRSLSNCKRRFSDFYSSSFKKWLFIQNMYAVFSRKIKYHTFTGLFGKLGEHPMSRITDHLNSIRHKMSVQDSS